MISESKDQLPRGKVLEGRYRIEEKLGAGGVGDVYHAEHLRLDRSVAIKVLQPNYAASQKLRLRFEREAHALATMAHPNIVSISDYGVAGNMPYLVMELLRGEVLSQMIKKGPLKPETAFEVVRQVLRALSFAHEKGLVHRDLKPGNIFLRPLAGDGLHVSILDFGLAKFVTSDTRRKGPRLTLTGMVFGTPAYMAPEQAVGSNTDARTDLYALGVVFFEMLTGRRLFEGQPDELMRQHLQAQPRSIQEARPDRKATPQLEAFLRQTLAKERGDRFDDAEEMLDVLEKLEQPAVTIMDSGAIDELGHTLLANPSTGNSDPPSAVTVQATPTGLSEKRKTNSSLVRIVGIIGAIFGLVLGITVAIPITICAVGSDGSEQPDPTINAMNNSVPVIPLRPPIQNPNPGHNPAQTSKTIKTYNILSGNVPQIVRQAKNKLDSGGELSGSILLKLRRYAWTHQNDARPFLLLGQNNIRRGARTDGITRYKKAYDIDPETRFYKSMQTDLVKQVGHRKVGYRSSKVIQSIYKRHEILAVIEAELRNSEIDEFTKGRLEALRNSL